MIAKLTLLHIVLAVMAAGGVYLAWREVRRLYISQWRLLAEWMDAGELKLREGWRQLRSWWRKHRPAARKK